MYSQTKIVKAKIAGFLSCFIVGIVARLDWPWNRRISLLVDRLTQIQEAGHE